MGLLYIVVFYFWVDSESLLLCMVNLLDTHTKFNVSSRVKRVYTFLMNMLKVLGLCFV